MAVSVARAGAPARAYHENVIDHYEVRVGPRGVARTWRARLTMAVGSAQNPRNVGNLDKKNRDVGSGLVGAPACGDVMKVQVLVKDGKVRNWRNGMASSLVRRSRLAPMQVVDAKFKTFGCASAIASSSFATEWVKGRTVEECMGIKNTDIAQHLKLPPVKLHCSMLAEDAIKAAIKDYQTKNDAGTATAAAPAASTSSKVQTA